MRTLLIAASIAALSTAAYANGNNGNNGNNNGPTNVDATATASNGPIAVNGGDNRATATVGNTTANGGSATLGNLNSFGGSATGGSVIAPVTTTVAPRIENDNRDTNIVGQDQGQLQGQLQGQGQRQSNVGVNGQHQTAVSGSTSGASSDQRQDQSLVDQSVHTLTATTGASTSGAQSSSAGQTATFTDNSVYEAQQRNPVSSAYAAPLSIGAGVCAYTPVSASGQGITLGLSGSVAKIDDGCERARAADMFARLGLRREACLIMLKDKHAGFLGVQACDRLVEPTPVAPVAAAVVTPPKPPVIMSPIPDPEILGERG